jgi:hypothetical protein
MRSSARCALVLLTFLYPVGKVMADNDPLDTKAILNKALASKGKRTQMGVWNGSACALAGPAPQNFIHVIRTSGTAPNGIVFGTKDQAIELSDLHPEILSVRTFKNCTTQADQTTRAISEQYTQSVTVTLTHSLQESISVSMTAGGNWGYASASTTVAGSRVWTTTTTNSQTQSETLTVADNISAPLPAGKEFDITVSVIRGESKIPIHIDTVLDGDFDPCLLMNEKKASQLLTLAERTYQLDGEVTFSHADNGTIAVSKERDAVCDAN